MPRVLRIINRFNLGGPTYNAAYLTRYLTPEFETLLVGGLKDESEAGSEYIVRSLGVEPVIIPEMRRSLNPFNDYSAYRKIKQLIRDFRPDIVHTHASKAGALGRMAASSCGVKVIVHTFHGHVFHSYFGKTETLLYKKLERFLARKTNAIIAISNRQKEELSTIHRICQEEKIHVIPLGFDLERFSENQEEKRKKFRNDYAVADDEIVIAIVGRLVPVKNHALFLRAVKHVSENSRQKIRAFIVGDGEERKNLEIQAGKLKLKVATGKSQATISFTSWIKEVDQVYAGSDIVALCSFNEGTPVSLIEAQAAGKAIVSTHTGGIEDIVGQESKSFLSEPGNEKKFTDNLMRLVEDKELCKKLGELGKKLVSERFSRDTLILNMTHLYRSIL